MYGKVSDLWIAASFTHRNNCGQQTRATNAANEITSTTGIAAPQYDRAGNMISTPKPGDEANSLTCTYDAWGRLVSTNDGTTTVTYEYDGQRRRTERIVGNTAEHYYYDDQQVVETRLPDEQENLQPDKQYVWSLRYVDTPVLRDSYSGGQLVAGSRLYYTTDSAHNVTAVTNAAGVVQERYAYDTYGKATVYDANWANPGLVSSVGNTLLFAGQEMDLANGLLYARARWYNVGTGGFLSRDPSGFAAGDMNLYRYVGNNPANRTDPSGHCLQTIENIGKILAGVSEFVIGVLSMPVTGPLGALVAVHGFDVALSGLLGLLTGTSVDTVTSQGLQYLGMSKEAANFVDMCISILGTTGVSLMTQYANEFGAAVRNAGNLAAKESGAARVGGEVPRTSMPSPANHVYTTTDLPVNLNRPSGTFVTTTDISIPQNYLPHVQNNVPWSPIRPTGELPTIITKIQVPPGSILPDPSVPFLPGSITGWIPPGGQGVVVKMWRVITQPDDIITIIPL